MLPLRYDFLSFGGSWAQRQVFNTTMIHAAINANKLQLALELVSELKVVCSIQYSTDYFNVDYKSSSSMYAVPEAQEQTIGEALSRTEICL